MAHDSFCAAGKTFPCWAYHPLSMKVWSTSNVYSVCLIVFWINLSSHIEQVAMHPSSELSTSMWDNVWEMPCLHGTFHTSWRPETPSNVAKTRNNIRNNTGDGISCEVPVSCRDGEVQRALLLQGYKRLASWWLSHAIWVSLRSFVTDRFMIFDCLQSSQKTQTFDTRSFVRISKSPSSHVTYKKW